MRTPSKRHSPVIGLPMSSLYDPYQMAIWNGIYEQARLMGIRLFCFGSGIYDVTDTSGATFYNLIDSTNIDALILIFGCFGDDFSTTAVKRFFKTYSEIPGICIGVNIPGYTSIVTENTEGIRKVITHLIQIHGCKRIAFIKGPEGNNEAQVRFTAYKQCLEEHGLEFDPALVCPGNFEDVSGYRAVTTLLDERKVTFDALAGVDDLSVLTAIETLKKRGYRIPEDIKVVGFDDIDKSQSSSPTLTTVRQPLFELGTVAVQKADELIKGISASELHTIPSKMIIRRSCGCVQHEHIDLIPPGENDEDTVPVPIDELIKEVLMEIDRKFYFTFSTAESQHIRDIICNMMVMADTIVKNNVPYDTLIDLLTEILTTFTRISTPLSLLEQLLYTIFHGLIRLYTDEESCRRLSSLWENILSHTYNKEAYFQSVKRIRLEDETDAIRLVGDQLITSFNLQEIKDLLVDSLPSLNINECYFTYYEKDYNSARLQFAMKDGIKLPVKNTVFNAAKLIPKGLAEVSNKSYYIISLISEHKPFGYVIFELTDTSARKYDTLAGKIASALHGAQLVAKIKQQNLALRESESEDLRTILNSIGGGVIAVSVQKHITRMNPVAEEMTGWSAADAAGLPLYDVFLSISDQHRDELENFIDTILTEGRPISTAHYLVIENKDGTERNIHYNGTPTHNENGNMSGVVLVFIDVSKQKKLAEEINHTQKMDAIGQLAGGVAHDFNNILAGIVGSIQVISMKPNNLDNVNKYAKLIFDMAMEAADLNKNLLAFSRKGKIQSISLDIHDCISKTVTILEHTIDKRIELRKDLKAHNPHIIGDPSQISNALLNLGLNARDAMPEGGKLEILTTNLVLNEKFCRESVFEIEPGDFVEVSIRDNGIGMTKETIKKIYEPFFTTKGTGKGTGLGLAAVYGIIKDHTGAIQVLSEPGKGSVFKIYLPNDKTEDVQAGAGSDTISKGEGVILLIDDEHIIRETTKELLEEIGYTVILAEDGEDGVEKFNENADSIDIVLLDMIMPKMNGHDTFKAIHAINSEIKVVVMSGFFRDDGVNTLIQEGACDFLQKPVHIEKLVKTIEEHLKL